MINKFKNKFSTGFTLVETLIAVLVLATAITGPLTIASKGLQATLIAKDQDTAFYLAQDAMEYVRWVRDTNKLQNSAGDWLASMDGTAPSPLWSTGTPTIDAVANDCVNTTGTAKCTVDSVANAIASCSGSCPAINYNSSTGSFGYAAGSGSATIFTRTVTIKYDAVSGPPNNTNEATVTVIVSWSDQAGITRNVTVREDIFNWQ